MGTEEYCFFSDQVTKQGHSPCCAVASPLSWKFSAQLSGFWAVHLRVAEVQQGWAEASHREQKLFCPFQICLHIPTLQGHHEVFPALGHPEDYLLSHAKDASFGKFQIDTIEKQIQGTWCNVVGKYTTLSAPYSFASLPVPCHSAGRAPGSNPSVFTQPKEPSSLCLFPLSTKVHPCSMSKKKKKSLTISSPTFPSPQSCTTSLWAAWSTAMLYHLTAALSQGSLPTFY